MGDKKKVLFSFVGMRDPYSYTPSNKSKTKTIKLWNWKMTIGKDQEKRSDGSVLKACSVLKPDIVYLFPSSKEKAAETSTPENHTEDKANEVREILTQQFGVEECAVMPLMTENPTDATSLYTCLRDNMRTAFKRLTADYPNEQDAISQKYELIFLLTSGTPQMSQTPPLYLPTLPYNFKYYRTIDPEHGKGKDRVLSVELKLADEMLLLNSIEADVESCHFHSAINSCERLSRVSVIKARKGRAAVIKDCFSAYENLELMNYEEAYKCLSGTEEFPAKKLSGPVGYCSAHKEQILAEQPTLPLEKISDILTRQAKFLESLRGKVRLKDEGEDVNNLVDLYYNMERAYVRGNYVDVLARFWRLREGMMNYRLWKYHHLNRRDLTKTLLDPKEEKQRKANCDLVTKSQYGYNLDWNIGTLSSVLRDVFNDAELKNFEKRYKKQLDFLRESRNHTIVAHGMLPVSKNAADICVDIAEEIIKLIPDGRQVCESYPFKLEDMREVLNLLKHI